MERKLIAIPSMVDAKQRLFFLLLCSKGSFTIKWSEKELTKNKLPTSQRRIRASINDYWKETA